MPNTAPVRSLATTEVLLVEAEYWPEIRRAHPLNRVTFTPMPATPLEEQLPVRGRGHCIVLSE